MALEFLTAEDPQVTDCLRAELTRQRGSVELIASENFTSRAVMEAVGSVLTNKYAEGYPGKRYYGGCEKVDMVEDLARDRACELYGAKYANVQPHSGASANFGAYLSIIEPFAVRTDFCLIYSPVYSRTRMPDSAKSSWDSSSGYGFW